MVIDLNEFDAFEKIILEFIGEFQSTSSTEGRLREALRQESQRADTAEAARAAAERTAAESLAGAAAASAGAAHAAAALARAHDELTPVKMQLDLTEKQRGLLEERCSELCSQLSSLERELQQLRGVQVSLVNLQRQYQELQDRVRTTTEEFREESSRLQAELRRVERSAEGGADVRSRARLAAAAHARDRRLAAADRAHANTLLKDTHAELARLQNVITELQHGVAQQESESAAARLASGSRGGNDALLAEARAALAAERAGAARLEKALAAALADNKELARAATRDDGASLATEQHQPEQTAQDVALADATHIAALDTFLAE